MEHYNAETGEMLSDEPDYNHSFYIDLIIRQVAGLEPTEDGFEVWKHQIWLYQIRKTRRN